MIKDTVDNPEVLMQRTIPDLIKLRSPHAVKTRITHPLYPLTDHPFWPDRKLMKEEATVVRTDDEQFDPTKKSSIKVHLMGADTPLLQQMWDNWCSLYGDCGDATVYYFYMNPEMVYDWHVDTLITTDHTSTKAALCAMNVVVTNEETPAEFAGLGEMSYTAALFNTSHMHRVVDTRGETRILARITFRDWIYEEVLHKIKKINKTL